MHRIRSIQCVNNSYLSVNWDFPLSYFDNPIFLCIISHTETSRIPGITIAGANPNLIAYTPPADAEFLYYGHCKCIDAIPVTPDGKPTPALITRVALKLSDIPFLVIDSGAAIKPNIPYLSFNIPSGNNIQFGNALDISHVKNAFEYGKLIGMQFAKSNDHVIIGESIPGGTTTALGVLSALGIDASFKVSSSMPENPHDLKNRIISQAMDNANATKEQLRKDPLLAISLFGDPMMPAMAGVACGVVNSGGKVLLAGGTQMCSIIAILKYLEYPVKGVSIGTTSFVANDSSSNLVGILTQITDQVPVYVIDLPFIQSSMPGLQTFARGFVKEGVGAGGSSIAAILKSNGQLDGKILLREIEMEYSRVIEKRGISF